MPDSDVLQIRMHIFDFVGGGRNSRKIGLYLFLQIFQNLFGRSFGGRGGRSKGKPGSSIDQPGRK